MPITAAKAAILVDFTDYFAQLIATLVAVIEIKSHFNAQPKSVKSAKSVVKRI